MCLRPIRGRWWRSILWSLLAAVAACPAYGADDSGLAAAQVAERLGISLGQVTRLNKERGLSNDALLQLPPEKLSRAVWRLENPKPDHPGEYASFRALQDQDDEGNIPENALSTAIEQLQAIREGQPESARAAGLPIGRQVQGPASGPQAETAGLESSTWQWLGPGNIGGRTRSIVIHPTSPNIMWAGSVGGGVWKTTNAGARWFPLADFMGNLAVSTLALDPTNPNVIYAGTGEGFFNADAIRGAGIFKSMNGGTTWSQLSSTNNANFHYVNRLSISKNGNVMLAATNRGVFRSTNNGSTWSAVPAPANVRMLDLDFHPSNSNLCVAGDGGGKAYYSTNAGSTWTVASGISNAARIEVTYAVANPNIVFASVNKNSGEVYRSTDGGKTYQLRNTGTNYLGGQGWYDNVIWAGASNDANLVIVGGVDLYRSTDGGTSFSRISNWWQAPSSAHADHHCITTHPLYNGTTNRTVIFGNDGGVYRARNVTTVTGTNGWQELNNNFGVTQFYGAAGHVGTGRIVGGTQDNGTLVFNPSAGPENWTTMFGGDGGWCAADPTDASFLYGEYVRLRIHRSTNGGTSSSYIYDTIADAVSGNANFIAPFILDPNNPNRLLGGGASLWRSNNVKAATPTFSAIKSASGARISAVAVHKGNSNLVWVGHNNGDVYKSVNGTAASPTWTKMDDNATTLPTRYCTRIATDPKNSNIVYVTFGGYTSGNIWKSTNGGNSWKDISSGLPQAPIRSVVVSPTNSSFVYLGTEVGVFASENGGTTWSPTNEGPANCSVDELFFMNTKLVAVTHGRGLFSIDLGGKSKGGRWGYAWANSPTSASYSPYHLYAFNGSGGPINIKRTGRGAYTVNFSGLGGNGKAGGHVQVTAYGGDNTRAKVKRWNSHGSDFIVYVQTYDAAGSPKDARYDVLVTWPSQPAPIAPPSNGGDTEAFELGRTPEDGHSGDDATPSPLTSSDQSVSSGDSSNPGGIVLAPLSKPRKGFAWANDPAANSYSPYYLYAYNSSGGTINIKRTGTGAYTVRFVGLGGKGRAGGHVQVTAYGADNNRAKVQSWNSGGSDFIVYVNTYNAAGTRKDARYNVAVTWPDSGGPVANAPESSPSEDDDPMLANAESEEETTSEDDDPMLTEE